MRKPKRATKRKIKYMKASAGSEPKIHLGHQWVTIAIRIPRKHFTERLVGRNGRHLKRLGILARYFRKK